MDTTPSMSVTDQFLALIASELSIIMGAYAIDRAGELEGMDEQMAKLAEQATTETIPALIKLAIKQNKGDE